MHKSNWQLVVTGCAAVSLVLFAGCGQSRPPGNVASPTGPGASGGTATAPPPTAPLPATISTDEEHITVRTDAGAVEVDRAPFALSVENAAGEVVLASAPQPATPLLARPADVQRGALGTDNPDAPALYAPISFLVGAAVQQQFPASFWVGNMLAATSSGVEYQLTDVQAVSEMSDGVSMQVATSDPTGRVATVIVRSDQNGSFSVSVRLSAVNQDVPLISAAFASPADETFRGFGGRRDRIDQRGQDFINWCEEFSQTPEAADLASQDGAVPNPVFLAAYQFPTGPQGAYYVQSQFISPGRYGFLLDRDELSHWRMASDRNDAWAVEVAGGALDFVVVPADSADAINRLTGLTGRHRLPPDWAYGPMLSDAVQSGGESAAVYAADVQESLDMIEALELDVSAFIFEGWVGLQDAGTYESTIERLQNLGIQPLTYFRPWVAQGDDHLERHEAYQEAIDGGFVAMDATGQPFLFGSPLVENGQAALIDFTNSDARLWWKDQIKDALDDGVTGFMQDFGEQTFVDMVFADGSGGLEMHNRYAKLFHETTREAFDEWIADGGQADPWFFVRMGYSGRPGSAAFESSSWPGDNTADWGRASGIGSVIPDMLNRSIGGAYGFVSEIGGYIDVGGQIDTELLVRWSQLGSLSPIHRLHGGPVNGTHMPWRISPEAVTEYKRTARRHRAAQPMIKQLWAEALQTGMPITRPLWLAFPDDPQAALQDQQFMLGPDVLAAPVVQPGMTQWDVYFPAGCWVHPETGDEYTGPGTETVDAPLELLPYYFRCGTQPFAVPEGGF